MKPTHPLAVDGHFRIRVQSQILDLSNLTHTLHIRRITSRPENDSDLGTRVDVVGGDEGSGGVVDEGGQLNGDLLWVR